MEDGSTAAAISVANIVNDCTFPVVEAHPELPLLPPDQVAGHLHIRQLVKGDPAISRVWGLGFHPSDRLLPIRKQSLVHDPFPFME